MPYFTKKGSGKDKNKVCVYKKSDKKKVGCTAGPIEKYLTALRMAESDDFDFISDTDSLNVLDLPLVNRYLLKQFILLKMTVKTTELLFLGMRMNTYLKIEIKIMIQ